MKGERWSARVFSARETMSNLKCHGNFRPEIYLINLRLLKRNESENNICAIFFKKLCNHMYEVNLHSMKWKGVRNKYRCNYFGENKKMVDATAI